MSDFKHRATTWMGRFWLGLTVAAVLAFYGWTVATTGAVLRPVPRHDDYYNLLARGFAAGHTYMEARVDPAMLALPPDQRPGNAPFLLDASLYGDHYYLYFGAVPVVLVQLPFKLLTGLELPEASVALLHATFLLFAGLWWWREVRVQYLTGSPVWQDVLAVLALGLCTVVPSALRRPMFYEIATLGGAAWMFVALACATRAGRNAQSGAAWLALAGMAVGLATGCRANLAPAGIVMLALAAALAARSGKDGSRRWLFLRGLGAAGCGAAAIGLGLMAYNVARFGSPIEFGHSYQLGDNPAQYFRLSNLWHNLGIYYGHPPALNGYFPFVAPGDEPPKPSDYIGREHAHGEWIWLIVLALGVAVWALARWRSPAGSMRSWAWLMLPTVIFAGNLLITGSAGVRSNRYMLDFHPALVALTLGLLVLGLTGLGSRGAVFRWGSVFVIGAASLFNVLGSIQSHGFFRLVQPAAYQRLAAVADAAVGRWIVGNVGDRVANVTWAGLQGTWRWEPLLAAGSQDFENTLWLEYGGQGQVRLVYQHGSSGSVQGEWFVPASPRSTVRISGAFLLPPVTHPWYGNRPAVERWLLKRRLRVWVDGMVRFDRDVISYDSSPLQQTWAASRHAWTGVSQTRIEPVVDGPPVDDTWLRPALAARGPVRLLLTIPADRYGSSEPLLQVGGAERFDTLSVRYVAPGRIRLVHDQLGGGAQESDEILVDERQLQPVEIEAPFAADGLTWTEEGPVETPLEGQGWRIRLAGREVFASTIAPVPASRAEVTVGANLRQSSSVRPTYQWPLRDEGVMEPIGAAGEGWLEAALPSEPWRAFDHGVLLRFERADGETAMLFWRRSGVLGELQFGWLETGIVSWSDRFDAEAGRLLKLRLRLPAVDSPAASAMVVVEAGGQPILTRNTDYFSVGGVRAKALFAESWHGSALQSSPALVAAGGAPGRIRLRFALAAGAAVGTADPLLTAGRTGAADLVYLRSVGEEKYVFGVDHWGKGATESAPVSLVPGTVQTVVIELSSLFPPGTAPRSGVRIWSGGALVLESTQVPYPATPAEVLYGSRLEGMSTSVPKLRGEVVSVRSRVSEP